MKKGTTLGGKAGYHWFWDETEEAEYPSVYLRNAHDKQIACIEWMGDGGEKDTEAYWEILWAEYAEDVVGKRAAILKQAIGMVELAVSRAINKKLPQIDELWAFFGAKQ